MTALFKILSTSVEVHYFIHLPIPDNISYQVKLIEKIESVLKRMRWKAHFFLNQSKKQDNIKQHMASNKTPPATAPQLRGF